MANIVMKSILCTSTISEGKVTGSPKVRDRDYLDILFIQSYSFAKFSVKLLCIDIPSNSRRVVYAEETPFFNLFQRIII